MTTKARPIFMILYHNYAFKKTSLNTTSSKLKTYSAEDAVKRMKRQAIDRKEIFSNHASDKGLI